MGLNVRSTAEELRLTQNILMIKHSRTEHKEKTESKHRKGIKKKPQTHKNMYHDKHNSLGFILIDCLFLENLIDAFIILLFLIRDDMSGSLRETISQ